MIRPGADRIELDVRDPVAQRAAALVAALEGEREVVMRVGVAGREADGRLVGLDRLGQPLQLVERIAQIEERQRVVGIGDGGAAVELLGALELALVIKDGAEVDGSGRVLAERERFFVERRGFGEPCPAPRSARPRRTRALILFWRWVSETAPSSTIARRAPPPSKSNSN